MREIGRHSRFCTNAGLSRANYQEIVAGIKSKSIFLAIYQRNPSTSNWIDSTSQIAFKFTNDELSVTTKLLTSIVVLFATSQPHRDIEEKLPPLLLQANQSVPISIQVLQNKIDKTSLRVQYKRHDNLLFDENNFQLVKSAKAKVRPWTKLTASLTNMIMKDEVNISVRKVINLKY